MLFRVPNGMLSTGTAIGSDSSGKLAECVDLKGRNSYIVAPGSVLADFKPDPAAPAANGKYRFRQGFAPWQIPIADVTPELLAVLLTVSAKSATAGAGKKPPTACELDTPELIASARDWLRDHAPEAIMGTAGRPATMGVLQRRGDIGLSAEMAVEVMLEDAGWNDTKAEPPWDFNELETLALTLGRNDPRGCPSVEDVFESYDALGEYGPKIEREDRGGKGAFKRIINPAGWEGLTVPPREWIVPDLIPHKTVTLLYGDGAAGKSLLTMQLAASRALALEWVGLSPRPGRTLILSAEDDADEMQRRLEDIRKFYGARMAELSEMRLVDLVGEDSVLGGLMHGRIAPTAMYHALDDFMAEFKPSLTAIDVLADAFAGDENNRPQAREFIGLLKRLALKHECAFLLRRTRALPAWPPGPERPARRGGATQCDRASTSKRRRPKMGARQRRICAPSRG